MADDEIDQAKADDWEAKYDGYEMIWTFTSPQNAAGDANIDAGCILGKDAAGVDYSGGGFCCGIIYEGKVSPQPKKWAIWAPTAAFDDHLKATGLAADEVDDIDNWDTEETSFTISWDISRWLPKQERSNDYYVNEYRFVAGQSVEVYTYKYNADDFFQLVKEADPKTLLGGLSGVSTAAAALVSLLLLHSF